MKKLIFLAVIFCLMVGTAYSAPSGCTIATSVVDHYADQQGEHTVLKIIITQTGTTMSFTPDDFTAGEEQRFYRGFVYWIGIDATGTLDAAPQLTVTDQWGFTQFSDTTSFHVSNPIKVLGNSYDGQYLHLTPVQTWSFNDVGSAEVMTMYLDVVR